MNNSGDAAEQVVKLYLEGVEVVARLTGSGAKNIGAILMSTLLQTNKTKGKSRLASMIRSGKPLRVFTLTQKDLKRFTKEAKKYGILYNVLRSRTDHSPEATIDIIVRDEDSAKIQRIVDRFKLATVDQAAIISDAQKDVAQREAVNRDVPEKSKGQRVYEEAMGISPQKEKNAPENPTAAKTERNSPSRHTSEDTRISTTQGQAINGDEPKPSVKAKLERYKELNRKNQENERNAPQQTHKYYSPAENGQTVHRQPQPSKKYKER